MPAYLIKPLQRDNPAWEQWQLNVTGFLAQGGYVVIAEDPETARHQAIIDFSHIPLTDASLDDRQHPFLDPDLAEVVEITGHSDR
ncbi:hypothetical protein [Kistimonas scapharcae]